MIDKFVAELKNLVPFKETTAPGDIVLLASDEPRMVVYALVSVIEPDPGRKRAWWNVTMQVLAVPPQEVVWTLREPQFTGKETFSFGGKEHFMKAVRFEAVHKVPHDSGPGAGKETVTGRKGLRVVK